jgi:hypothetical protein
MSTNNEVRTELLLTGVLSALLYTAMLVFVPLAWDGYSSAAQTVSELSAIDSPTRSLWVPLGLAWSLLYGLFGASLWLSAKQNRPLRVTGAIIAAAAVLGVFWPPMHLREVIAAGGKTVTDALHVVWTAANGLLTLVAMAFGAAALGKRFRVYTIGTMTVLLVAGVMTATYASRLEANLPTPGAGVWERVNIGAWLLWILVLAVAVVRAGRAAGETSYVRRTR